MNINDAPEKVAELPWSTYFQPGEMSALWARLANKMSAADPGCKAAWGALNKLPMREGKQGKKRTVLWLALKYPGDWATRSTTFIQKVVRMESTSAKEVPKTKGELIQIHGLEETEELLKQGFFEMVQVRGVPHYVKVSFERENKIEKHNEESMSLTKLVGKDEVEALESSFENYKLAIDTNWTSSGWTGSGAGKPSGNTSTTPPSVPAGCAGDTKASSRKAQP